MRLHLRTLEYTVTIALANSKPQAVQKPPVARQVRAAITYNTVVLADAKSFSNPVDTIDEVIAAVEKWDIGNLETFVSELLDYFFIEIFGLRCKD